MLLRRPLRTALLIVHLVVTVAALGTDLALLALGVAGLRGADPRTVYPAGHLLGQWLMVPLAVASLATGLTLSVSTRWKPLVPGWVTAKAAITVLLTGLLVASLVPALGRAADAATGTAAAPLTHAQQTLLVAAPPAPRPCSPSTCSSAWSSHGCAVLGATCRPRRRIGRIGAVTTVECPHVRSDDERCRGP